MNSHQVSTSHSSDRQRQFYSRLMLSVILVLLLFGILLSRLIYLQINQYQIYLTQAKNNHISLVPIQPIRGQILDRNGLILARNYSAYTLEIIPSKTNGVPQIISDLSKLIDLSKEDLKRFKKAQNEAKNFEPITLKLKLSNQEAARVAANGWRFPGVIVRARLFRDYPYKDLTSHVIGYISRINSKEKNKLEKSSKIANYRGASYIGKTGLEFKYEEQLRGKLGFEEIEVDSSGHAIRTIHRQNPVNGKNLQLTLDMKTQELADKLFASHRGALVAIDPQNGGIIAFISKPSFDANLFIDGIDKEKWDLLNNDWQKPLINRALRGLYPPGSTFKPFIAVSALQSKTLGYNDIRPAPGFFTLPGSSHKFRDSVISGHGAVNLQRAIIVSSDTFFYRLAWEMGIDKLSPLLANFGFGKKTGIDLNGEYKGILPSRNWKYKAFARYKPAARKWFPSDIVSVGIGQGFNAYTPLQMANAVSILSNGGTVYKPHLVNKIVDSYSGVQQLLNTKAIRQTPFKAQDIDYVKHAMEGVLKPGGTAGKIGIGLTYSMGGKTGTAQVVQIKQGAHYNAAMLPEKDRDHSWFIAFAPVDKPKIALAVIVENAGWGGKTAAPIARAITDFYIKGKLPANLQTQMLTIKTNQNQQNKIKNTTGNP